uniref:Aldo_ket_red domain-containing protein n=1 Tax=Heterorhabditis bacteriophora TaxID=37862 RepID=A0A1I7XB24_HETBA
MIIIYSHRRFSLAAMSAVSTIKLSSGYDMPLVGLGTWQSNPGEVGKAVETAIRVGYRHIDCAWVYANQNEVGEALKKSIGRIVKREELFITSKIWNTFHSESSCKASVDEILSQLQLDYVDLMLIHWPMGYEEGGDPFPKSDDGTKMRYSNEDYITTWKTLENIVKTGKIRSIGISNFNHKQIDRILNIATITPAVLQVELHPYFQQKKLREFCKDNNIVITAYSPLGNPGSTMFRKEGDPNIMADEVLKEISKTHGKSIAQIALRWEIQHNIIVIPKSVTEGRIKENINIFDFALSETEMATIDKLDQNWRFVDLTFRDSDHPHFPFLEEY